MAGSVVEQHLPDPLAPGFHRFMATRTICDTTVAGAVVRLNSQNGNVDLPLRYLAMELDIEIS